MSKYVTLLPTYLLILLHWCNVILTCPFPHTVSTNDVRTNSSTGKPSSVSKSLDSSKLFKICTQLDQQSVLDAEKRDEQHTIGQFTKFYGLGFGLTMLMLYVTVCLGVICCCRLGFIVRYQWIRKQSGEENESQVVEDENVQRNNQCFARPPELEFEIPPDSQPVKMFRSIYSPE